MKYLKRNTEAIIQFKDCAVNPILEVINQTTKSSSIYKLVNKSDKFGNFSVKLDEFPGDYSFIYLDGSVVLEKGLLRIIGENKTLMSDNLKVNLTYE